MVHLQRMGVQHPERFKNVCMYRISHFDFVMKISKPCSRYDQDFHHQTFFPFLQQFGEITDTEIIFNERGSKVREQSLAQTVRDSSHVFLGLWFRHFRRE